MIKKFYLGRFPATRLLYFASRVKGNQTMKLGQLIKYNKKHTFLQTLWRKCGRETSLIPLQVFLKTLFDKR